MNTKKDNSMENYRWLDTESFKPSIEHSFNKDARTASITKKRVYSVLDSLLDTSE